MDYRKSTSRGERRPALALNGGRTPPIRRREEWLPAPAPERLAEKLPAWVVAPMGARMRPLILELREGVVVRAAGLERGVCSWAWADEARGELVSAADGRVRAVAGPAPAWARRSG